MNYCLHTDRDILLFLPGIYDGNCPYRLYEGVLQTAFNSIVSETPNIWLMLQTLSI